VDLGEKLRHHLTDREPVASGENKTATFVGVLLTVLGAMDVVLEKKLSLYQ
jgi:hypothetical protein